MDGELRQLNIDEQVSPETATEPVAEEAADPHEAPEVQEEAKRPQGFLRREMAAFWAWYERHYLLNITIALGLFLLQAIHLVWLSLDVVAERAVGTPIWSVSGAWLTVLVVVDYFEVPALISVSLVYIHQIRNHGFSFKPVLYLVLLNSQWLHLFWITDEFVLDQFRGEGLARWPGWLAWVAIGIDYLEVPVMVDATKRFFKAIFSGGSLADVREALDHH